ncbi:MAG: flagellar motor protein MotB [Peptococcaceae bacterium]
MFRRKRRDEKHSGMERWLITYADMITLLLIFFIVMYSLGQLDLEKFRYLAQSLSQAMGGGGTVLISGGPSVASGKTGVWSLPSEAEQQELKQLANVQEELTGYIKESNLQTKVSVTSEERGIVLSFQEEVLFVIGSAELTPKAREIIQKIYPVLHNVPNYIRVEGHTCDLPIHNTFYHSNWELSSARAIAVVKELFNKHSFPPQRLAALAYGEYRPRVRNDSETHRQMNRRVDIVILRSEYQGSEPALITNQKGEN